MGRLWRCTSERRPNGSGCPAAGHARRPTTAAPDSPVDGIRVAFPDPDAKNFPLGFPISRWATSQRAIRSGSPPGQPIQEGRVPELPVTRRPLPACRPIPTRSAASLAASEIFPDLDQKDALKAVSSPASTLGYGAGSGRPGRQAALRRTAAEAASRPTRIRPPACSPRSPGLISGARALVPSPALPCRP